MIWKTIWIFFCSDKRFKWEKTHIKIMECRGGRKMAKVWKTFSSASFISSSFCATSHIWNGVNTEYCSAWAYAKKTNTYDKLSSLIQLNLLLAFLHFIIFWLKIRDLNANAKTKKNFFFKKMKNRSTLNKWCIKIQCFIFTWYSTLF